MTLRDLMVFNTFRIGALLARRCRASELINSGDFVEDVHLADAPKTLRAKSGSERVWRVKKAFSEPPFDSGLE
jgi:hypothetical protein